MSDTPRVDAATKAAIEHGTGDVWFLAMKLERELNAATSEVERLRKANLQLREGAEEQKQRIKRLEEELDRFTCVVELTPMKWSRSLQEAFDMARAVLKAKEAKL